MALRFCAHSLVQHRDDPDRDGDGERIAARAAEAREILGISEFADDVAVMEAFRDIARAEGFTTAELAELERQVTEIFESAPLWEIR